MVKCEACRENINVIIGFHCIKGRKNLLGNRTKPHALQAALQLWNENFIGDEAYIFNEPVKLQGDLPMQQALSKSFAMQCT